MVFPSRVLIFLFGLCSAIAGLYAFLSKVMAGIYLEAISLLMARPLANKNLADLITALRTLSSREDVVALYLKVDGQTIFSHSKESGLNFIRNFMDSSLRNDPYELSVRVGLPNSILVLLIVVFLFTVFAFILIRSMAKREGALLQAEFYNAVEKFAHDVRQPLALIESKSSELNSEVLVDSAIYIKQISEDLLSFRLKRIKETFDPLDHLKQCTVKSKVTKLKIHFDGNKYFMGMINVWASRSQLTSLYQNILLNSEESGSTDMSIKVRVIGSSLTVEFEDNGSGFSKEVLESIGKKEFTTKVEGRGIGLKRCLHEVAKDSIDVEFKNGIFGARVIVTFKKIKIVKRNPSKSSKWILIDDDKYVRSKWYEESKKNDHVLLIFPSYKEFQMADIKYDDSVVIFIDSHLPDGRGEELSLDLYRIGFREIYLITGFFSGSIDKYPHLKGVLQKDYPTWLLENV